MKKGLACLMALCLLLGGGAALAEDSVFFGTVQYPGIHMEASVHVNPEAFREIYGQSGAVGLDDEMILDTALTFMQAFDHIKFAYAADGDSLQFAVKLNEATLFDLGIGWDAEKLTLITSLLPKRAFTLGYEEALANLISPQAARAILALAREMTPLSALRLLMPYGADAAEWAAALPKATDEEGLIHSESYENHALVNTWTVTGAQAADLVDKLLNRLERDEALQEILLKLDAGGSREKLLAWIEGMRQSRTPETWPEAFRLELAEDGAGRPVGGAFQVLVEGEEQMTLSLGAKEVGYCFEMRFPVDAANTFYLVMRLSPVEISDRALVMDMVLREYMDEPGKTVSQLARESQALMAADYTYELRLDAAGKLTYNLDACANMAEGVGTRVSETGDGVWTREKMDVSYETQLYGEQIGTEKPLATRQIRLWSGEVPPLELKGRERSSLFDVIADAGLQETLTEEMEDAAQLMVITLYQNLPAEYISSMMEILVHMMQQQSAEQAA